MGMSTLAAMVRVSRQVVGGGGGRKVGDMVVVVVGNAGSDCLALLYLPCPHLTSPRHQRSRYVQAVLTH